jgi:hypothetical protein
MDTTRRSVLIGIGAALCAPAIVRASSFIRSPEQQTLLDYLNRQADHYILDNSSHKRFLMTTKKINRIFVDQGFITPDEVFETPSSVFYDDSTNTLEAECAKSTYLPSGHIPLEDYNPDNAQAFAENWERGIFVIRQRVEVHYGDSRHYFSYVPLLPTVGIGNELLPEIRLKTRGFFARTMVRKATLEDFDRERMCPLGLSI